MVLNKAFPMSIDRELSVIQCVALICGVMVSLFETANIQKITDILLVLNEKSFKCLRWLINYVVGASLAYHSFGDSLLLFPVG